MTEGVPAWVSFAKFYTTVALQSKYANSEPKVIGVTSYKHLLMYSRENARFNVTQDERKYRQLVK